MKIRGVLQTVALSAMGVGLMCAGGAAYAAGAAKSVESYPKGHYAALNSLPDWGGVWILNPPAAGHTGTLPALKGKYLKAYQAYEAKVKAHHGHAPRLAPYCRPPGMPGIMAVPHYPMAFLFTPGRVTVHQQAWMEWRRIFTDGRTHPQDPDMSFEGNSIGHWDGNTLVVDTVAIKDLTPLAPGMTHSPKLHVVERIHLAKGDPNTLVDDMTAYDPLALAKPWHHVLTYHRDRTGHIAAFICQENDGHPINAPGYKGK